LPLFSPALLLAIVIAGLAGLFLLRLVEALYAEGQLKIRLFRRQRPVATFDLRDTWMLLLLSVVMGWAVAAAVERAAWVTDSDGRLVPAMAIAVILGWVLAVSRFPRVFSLLAGIAAVLAPLALLSPTPLTSGGVPSIASLQKWLADLPAQSGLALLIGLILPGDKGYEGWVWQVGDKIIPYGKFLGAVVNFLIIAFILFLVVRQIGKFQRLAGLAKEAPPLTKSEVLLTEIRDLLTKP